MTFTTMQIEQELKRRQRDVKRLVKRREKIVRWLEEVDREIAANGGKVKGRKRAKNGVTLRDALAAALKGKKLGIPAVIEAVQKAGYVTTSPRNFRTMVNQALINKPFKRVSRGVYTV